MSNDGGNEEGSDDGRNGEDSNDGRSEEDSNDGRTERDLDDGDETGSAGNERPAVNAVSLSLDETLEILANYERRYILGYLMNAPDGTATVDELVDHLMARRAERVGERPGRSHVSTTLHHVHLPKLADAGVVEYDARSQEVRYWESDRLEGWHDCILDREKK